MSAGVLSQQQIRSLVDDKWQRDPQAVAVGIRVDPSVKGPNEVEFDFGKARVVSANNVLRVREALSQAEQNQEKLVLLTDLGQGELGNDVVARLLRCRLFPIDNWATVGALFKAKELDRAICNPVLAEALIENAPPDGYPPVKAGVLDAGTVWKAICRHIFGMGEREPDLPALLIWAASEEGTASYQRAGRELRECLRQRLASSLGEAASSVLQFMESGAGPEALALAVCCQVVFGNDDSGYLEASAARMEQYHGNRPIPKMVGRLLGRTATSAILDLDHDEANQTAVRAHLQKADEFIKQFQCLPQAHRNQLTMLGYEQRLVRLAEAVARFLKSRKAEAASECEAGLVAVSDHRQARLGRRPQQVGKAAMAVRLVRWLATETTKATSLADHANRFIEDGAYVDWAREQLCRGDESPEFSEALLALDREIHSRRAELTKAFATALADWTSVGSKSSGVLGVEDVLSDVVTKLVKAGNKVLFLVLDGMSWAVCHELLEDIRQDQWFLATLDEGGVPPVPVLATCPSVTHYSRCSLLSGKLVSGDQATEKRNFESHAALREVCDRRYPPVLFHKKDLTEGSRGAISAELEDRILMTHNHVVGAVVNAIDDRLSSAQQVADTWSISRINPLGTLLRLARDSGRVVVLASDHGHVWHRPDAKYRAYDTGSRWRPDDGKCGDGEIVLTGKRVRGDNGEERIIAPWSESIYFGRQQNGYHGGASPQEMVCPLVILNDRNSSYSGVNPCELPKPDWWSPAPTAVPVVEEPQALVKSVAPRRERPQLDLFEQPPVSQPKAAQVAAPSADWIEYLLKSQAYQDQKALIRRHAPEDAQVRISLETLSANGDVMTPAAFARATGIPEARLDPLVAQMQRILNVDGYDILLLDRASNRIEINIVKLKRQFDLE